MSTAALLLALAAAVLHATWNLLLARARDVQAATAVVAVLSVVLFAPVAAVTWDVERAVWPYAIGSAVFELAYISLLAYAYQRADLSVVYPVARGLAPVIVLLVSFAVVTRGEAAGVVMVAAGVALVRGLGRTGGRAVALGVAIAVCIAGYTLLDNEGIEHADPFGYLELVVGVPALLYLGWAVRTRGAAAVRAELGPATVVAALASFAAYALVLIALDIEDAAPVAAVRETSVVIAVALAAIFLRERVTRARAAGAVLVVAGIAVLGAA